MAKAKSHVIWLETCSHKPIRYDVVRNDRLSMYFAALFILAVEVEYLIIVQTKRNLSASTIPHKISLFQIT